MLHLPKARGAKGLDDISIRILEELQKHPRIPFLRIARSLGIDSKTVKYRVEKMQKSGAIRGFFLEIDPTFFGGQEVALLVDGHDLNAAARYLADCGNAEQLFFTDEMLIARCTVPGKIETDNMMRNLQQLGYNVKSLTVERQRTIPLRLGDDHYRYQVHFDRSLRSGTIRHPSGGEIAVDSRGRVTEYELEGSQVLYGFLFADVLLISGQGETYEFALTKWSGEAKEESIALANDFRDVRIAKDISMPRRDELRVAYRISNLSKSPLQVKLAPRSTFGAPGDPRMYSVLLPGTKTKFEPVGSRRRLAPDALIQTSKFYSCAAGVEEVLSLVKADTEVFHQQEEFDSVIFIDKQHNLNAKLTWLTDWFVGILLSESSGVISLQPIFDLEIAPNSDASFAASFTARPFHR